MGWKWSQVKSKKEIAAFFVFIILGFEKCNLVECKQSYHMYELKKETILILVMFAYLLVYRKAVSCFKAQNNNSSNLSYENISTLQNSIQFNLFLLQSLFLSLSLCICINANRREGKGRPPHKYILTSYMHLAVAMCPWIIDRE